MRHKKGQLEIGFNWIYILIAGAVILMFFLGIVIKQKTVSEEKLSGTVLRKIEGIFMGAGLSEKTVNVVEVPEITLVFNCDDKTGYSDYAVKGTGVKAETTWQPVFAPKEMTTQRIVTWTLEWRMPFKVINYLFISSPNIKYYFFGGEDYVLPEQFVSENVSSYAEIKYNNEEQVRLVFFDDTLTTQGRQVPAALANLPDGKVTAVEFTAGQSINFYEEENNQLVKINTDPVPLLDSFTLIDNANVYGAIFSTDPEMYKCNLRKAFKRLEILNRLNQERMKMIRNELTDTTCQAAVDLDIFEPMKSVIEDCRQAITYDCLTIEPLAEEIDKANSDLGGFCRVWIY